MALKIIDSFVFYNELDMLNYRLEVLDPYVDYFVLVESTYTHSGFPKTLYFNNNKSLFTKFLHKIVHVIMDDFPHKIAGSSDSSNMNGYSDGRQWENEIFQREKGVPRGLKRIPNIGEDDYVICSDLDEIVNPRVIQDIREGKITGERHSLEMDMYYYNLTNCLGKWNAPCLQRVRCAMKSSGRWSYIFDICNAGWHLSYFGDSGFIKNKLKHFGHQEYNTEEYTNESRINEAIKNGKDLFNRENVNIKKIEIKDNPNLPPRLDLLGAFLGP